jgi:Pin2-interacting protein X1
VKLSHDPNNTKWTRDSGGFGHKIMAAQGWQPGDILGAKNASHAEFHTAANASHIRVFVKDDNLGLGAKMGSGLAEGECTGLDVFQSLLGRLNGKDEDELTKEQKSREDLKRAIYTERRWGSVRFVRGGFLIGDKIQELIDNKEDRIRRITQDSSDAVIEASGSDLSRSSEQQDSQRLVARDKKNRMNKKKRQKAEKEQEQSTKPDIKKRNKSEQSIASVQNVLPDILLSEPKKSKKKRKILEETGEEVNTSDYDEQYVSRESKKKKKKKRKEGKRLEQLVEGGTTASTTPIPQSLASTSGSSTPQSLLGGRHAVRSRNIAQKRLAVLDTTSLNQVSGQISSFKEFGKLIAY